MSTSASLSVTAGMPISTQHGSAGRGRAIVLSLPSNHTLPQGLGLVSAHSNLKGRRGSFKTAVASVDSNQISSSSVPPEKEANKYYFVVANAKFMLDEEEHFQELLFERLRNYGERSKEQDFWLVIEPKFLDKFPNITKRLRRPAVALVSTNGPWITDGQWTVPAHGPRPCPFMKLRLDRVLSDSYEAGSLEEALASNPATLKFEKQEKWVAPYPKYEFGWWEAFLPTGSKGSKV
ncbi:Ycf54-like protein [Citrus sinensis]|uniref:Ycf54-like protein n=1 Tax=Citrus sinensis TaxID=2711 RepID=A0ACB8JIH9_CITSI|nr:Ycf54-like protein [Citrus sinensis]